MTVETKSETRARIILETARECVADALDQGATEAYDALAADVEYLCETLENAGYDMHAGDVAAFNRAFRGSFPS